MTAFFDSALCRFLILYGVLYAGFGVQSPETAKNVSENFTARTGRAGQREETAKNVSENFTANSDRSFG